MVQRILSSRWASAIQIAPLRRACTPTPRPRSRLVGASIARVGPSRESRSFHSQLKPCGRAGLPGIGFPSCWVNNKLLWHLVPSHAAPRFTSVRPNPSPRERLGSWVPNQKKRRDDALGVWKTFSNARYGNALRGTPWAWQIDKRPPDAEASCDI